MYPLFLSGGRMYSTMIDVIDHDIFLAENMKFVWVFFANAYLGDSTLLL